MLFDTNEMLTSIKTRGMVPANAGSWSDDELLRAATEEIYTWHLPLLVMAKGEYLVKDEFLAVASGDNAFPAAAYDMSYRAAAVRLVKYVTGLVTDAATGSTSAAQESPLEELTPPEQASFSLSRVTRGTPRWFTFREGKVEVYPAPSSASGQAAIWVKWHMRPNRLTLVTNCRQITNIALNTPTAGKTRLTVAAVGSSLAGATGTLYDFVGYRNPFSVKAWDVPSVATVIAGATTLDVAASSLLQAGGGTAGVAVGDWLCPAEKTPMPNIPSELHICAALRAAAAATGARNPRLKQELIAEAYAKEVHLLSGILAPRSKGNMKRLVNRRW